MANFREILNMLFLVILQIWMTWALAYGVIELWQYALVTSVLGAIWLVIGGAALLSGSAGMFKALVGGLFG